MTGPPGARPTTAPDVLSRARIGEVYEVLTGITPRRTGSDTWRGPAPWRGGDSPESVAGDDARGVWHDFVMDEGGGILDLVKRIRGGNRADALRWCADFAGVPLDERPVSTEDRARWVAERRELERDLRGARYWRRAAVTLGEETLEREKSRLFDPTDRPADLDAIRGITGMLKRLKGLGDTALVAEYRWWCERYPCTTAAMVRWARRREELDAVAVARYMGLPMTAAQTYLREVRA